MHKLITNCPNCAAPLSTDGYCRYCDSKIRYANEIEINCINQYITQPIELLLKINDKNKTILLPLCGNINNIEINYYPKDITDTSGHVVRTICGNKEVNFDFTGTLRDNKGLNYGIL